jgi:formylglycine-generating enzyme required for sulfatase activity
MSPFLSRRFARGAAGLTGAFAISLATGPHAQAQAPGDTFTQVIPGTDVSLEMAFVPAGLSMLGSPDDEPGRDADEGPLRNVSMDAFWMGVHEVTFEAYTLFMYRELDDHVGTNGHLTFDADAISRPSPAYEDPAHGMGRTGHPMVGITRVAAMEFARWLSEKSGRLYRLPTEAEWERACRAGGRSAYGFGDDPAELDSFAWYGANSGGAYHPVGSKAPNAFGIHDLHGNVAEWTMDRYDLHFYERIPQDGTAANPRTEESTVGLGVVRGGAFDDDEAGLRCADRFRETSAWKRRDPQMPRSRWWNTDSPHVGFRLVSPAGEHTPEEIHAYWERILGAR